MRVSAVVPFVVVVRVGRCVVLVSFVAAFVVFAVLVVVVRCSRACLIGLARSIGRINRRMISRRVRLRIDMRHIRARMRRRIITRAISM